MSEITFHGLIEDLENYLAYQRDEGVVRMEVERAVLEELTREPQVEDPETVTVEAAPIPSDFKNLEEIAAHVAQCRNCSLCAGRTHTVPGEGNGDEPDLMFVAELPGREEDAQGRPLLGKPGVLLTKMIEAMGYRREDVFITTVLKCHSPDRKPGKEEIVACAPYLREQIRLIRPKAVVGFGAIALEGLLGRRVSIARQRGVWQEVNGLRVMPTFHPSYLLRDPSKKKEVWADLKAVLKLLGKEPPAR